MINFRTDLALERRDLFKKANNISNEVDGLETQEESFTDDIKISRVKVLNENYYIVTGTEYNSGCLAKLDNAGNILWQKNNIW